MARGRVMPADTRPDLAQWLAEELVLWQAEIERDVGDAKTAEVILLVNRVMGTVDVQVRVTRAYRKRKAC